MGNGRFPVFLVASSGLFSHDLAIRKTYSLYPSIMSSVDVSPFKNLVLLNLAKSSVSSPPVPTALKRRRAFVPVAATIVRISLVG